MALRFFHGFPPPDVARLLRTPTKVVHEDLRKATAEVRAAFDRRQPLPPPPESDTSDPAAFLAWAHFSDGYVEIALRAWERQLGGA